jgi:hypothetical protein
MNRSNNIISYHRNLNNQFDAVEWIIDTTPDYNLINNIQNTHPIYEVSNQHSRSAEFTEIIINNDIQFINEDDVFINEDDVFINEDDVFIPFESQIIQPISIETEVRTFSVSEEERFCCICYETKEFTDISQINCGHKFCGNCIIDHISINHVNKCCPLCREKVSHITFQCYSYQNTILKFCKNLSKIH